MSFGVVSVTAETDCPLTVSFSVTAVSGKTTFGRSLNTRAILLYAIVKSGYKFFKLSVHSHLAYTGEDREVVVEWT